MVEFGIRVRNGEPFKWNSVRRRETLAGDPARIRVGDNPADLARMIAQRQLLATVAVGPTIYHCQLEMPSMLDVPGESFKIMEGVVTAGLFNQFVAAAGYVITGDNGSDLQASLAGAPEKVLTWLSLLDGRALAKTLSDQTGKNWRVPTEAEWLAAKKLVGDQLSGNLWEWTETIYSGHYHVLRSLSSANKNNFHPDIRYSHAAVRLVEDK